MALVRESLVEYVTTPQGLSVHREQGYLGAVKVLGLESLNGRRYNPAGVRKAKGLYEGKQVNIDHGSKATASRSAHDRFGWLEGLYVQDDGLYARKLNFLKSHAMAGPIAEAAERNPGLFALSHNAIGNSRHDGDGVVVEEIEEVLSVDIVADGATCRSLHESRDRSKQSDAATLRAVYARRLRGIDEAISAGVYSRQLREDICRCDGEPEIQALVAKAKKQAPQREQVEVPRWVKDGRDLAEWMRK